MTIAILATLIVVGVMVIRRLDTLLWFVSEGRYIPWYSRLREFFFNGGPIFKP